MCMEKINCCAKCYVKNHHQKEKHKSVSVTRCLVSFKMLGCMEGHGFRFQSLMVQAALFRHCVTAWLFDNFQERDIMQVEPLKHWKYGRYILTYLDSSLTILVHDCWAARNGKKEMIMTHQQKLGRSMASFLWINLIYFLGEHAILLIC